MGGCEKPDDDCAAWAHARPGKFFVVEASSSDLGGIAALIDSGDLKVVISARYPLERVAEAQGALEKGGVRGKALVTVGESSP